jgi:excisionase family DNA binding protein
MLSGDVGLFSMYTSIAVTISQEIKEKERIILKTELPTYEGYGDTSASYPACGKPPIAGAALMKRRPSAPPGPEPATSPPALPVLPEFLTIPEVAARLRVSPRTVHRWLADQQLAAHQFGRAVRIATADLARFVATSRNP